MAPRGEEAESVRRNVRLLVEYDGTDFSGWQKQPGCRTVQQELEDAVARVTGETVSVVGSGRTDAGVHAEGQVASFRTGSQLAPERLAAAINSHTGEDLVVLSACDAASDFHPIRDAAGKTYRYTIATREVRPVLDRRRAWWVRRRLDVEAMRRAAAHLVGTHDFNSFRNEGKVEKDTVRTIESIDIVQSGDMLEIFFRGGGFLYMMVRIMVGTLVDVGAGRTDAAALPEILEARNRDAAGETAPAHGLTLVEVRY